MKENFIIILQAFEEAGVDVGTAEFSITEYSLKTKLSFKFEGLSEFFEFLQLHGPAENEKKDNIKKALVEKSIDPNNFFYVNFYHPKVAEL